MTAEARNRPYVDTTLTGERPNSDCHVIGKSKQRPARQNIYVARVGTAAMTTRGLNESDMEQIVVYIDRVLMNHDDAATLATVKEEINEWMKAYPLFKS